jgi:hypothetical protein
VPSARGGIRAAGRQCRRGKREMLGHGQEHGAAVPPPSFHYRGSEYVRKTFGYVRKGSGLYCTRSSRLDYVSRPCAGPALAKRTLGIPGPRRSELVCAVMQRVGAAFVSGAPSCRGTWLFLVSASGVSLPLRIPGCGSTPLNVR